MDRGVGELFEGSGCGIDDRVGLFGERFDEIYWLVVRGRVMVVG